MHRALMFVVLALAGCGRAPAPPRAAAAPPIVDHTRPAKRLGDLPPAEAAAAVDAAYRLLPDRRFLLAVRDIYAFQRGQSASVNVDFENDAWRIRCGGRDAGRLPLIPSFADGFSLLTTWSKSLGPLSNESLDAKTRDACDRRIGEFYAASLFDAMKGLRKPTGSSVERAARAAVDLELQTSDVFELGDPLAARALALLAMARASNAQFGGDETALLANALRYDAEARELASSLPARSAARIATGLDAPRVDAADPRMAYLSAQRVILTTPRTQRQIRIPDVGTHDVRALPLLLASDDTVEAGEVTEAVQALLTGEVTGRATGDRVRFGGAGGWIEAIVAAMSGERPGALAAAYESAIGSHAAKVASPLLDSAVVRAYFDATYYTSLERQLRISTDQFSSEPMAKAFLSELGKSSAQPGHDVREALAMIVATTFGSGRGATSKQLLALTNIGAASRTDLFINLSRMHGYDVTDRDAEIPMFSSLDTRPAQRLEAGLAAITVTSDPMRRDLYVRSALQAAPRIAKPGSISYFAQIVGDLKTLRELAGRVDVAPVDRAMAARYLAEAGDNETADRTFDVLFRESDYGEFYTTWVGVINARGDWPAKERATRRWLAAHPMPGIEHAYYSASLGNSLERQGRYREAWKVVEPEIGVWSSGIIERAVSLLQRLGRVRESDELGARLVERYPDASNRVGYAAVLWRQKRWKDAAALFDPKRSSISISDWRDHVPEELAKSFEHAPAADVAAAVGALADAGVNDDFLDMVPGGFAKLGHPDLAFAVAEAMCRRYPLKNEPVSGQWHVEAYRALEAWKGKDAAIAWLRPLLNDQNALEAASLLFQNHEDEGVLALADFAPRVRTDEMHAYLAQAMTRLRLPAADPRVSALRNEVAGKKWNRKSLDPIPLYLLGLMNEKDFLGWPYEAGGGVVVSYIIGLKAAGAGDYDRALRNLIAARHGAFGTSPQLWAVGMLNHWSTQPMLWRDVVGKRIL